MYVCVSVCVYVHTHTRQSFHCCDTWPRKELEEALKVSARPPPLLCLSCGELNIMEMFTWSQS